MSSRRTEADRLERVHRVLGEFAVEIGAWADHATFRRSLSVEVFRQALIDIADDMEAAKIVVQFGSKIPLMPHSIPYVRWGPAEDAIRWMMYSVASAVSDPNCRAMVPAKKNVETGERIEENLLLANSSTPPGEEQPWLNNYVFQHLIALGMLAPPDDPIVEYRRPVRRPEGVSEADYNRARAVRARVRLEGRRIFGKAGDRVVDALIYAATGVPLSKDHRKRRFKL
jgi:hypothetical protein